MVVKITAETEGLSVKLFKTHEFFPIDINFGDKEKIRISKRPRKAKTEIVDIYANDTHIGMFVGIEKIGDLLSFGPAGINKSHSYRQILNYTFIKLFEYYGLTGINAITIDVPEDSEFKSFLIALGFVLKGNRFLLEMDEKNIKNLLLKLDELVPEVQSQVGQIETVIRTNNPGVDSLKIEELTDQIVSKIKNMDPIGKNFWDNRKIAQINHYLSVAILSEENLNKEEFLDLTIKTIVTSFDTYVRDPYLEELFLALEGKRAFSMPYIQKMVEKMKPLLSSAIKELEKDKYRKWVSDNLESWTISDQVAETTRKETIANAQLKPSDFGTIIQDSLKGIITDLIHHYNGENIFFGVNNRF